MLFLQFAFGQTEPTSDESFIVITIPQDNATVGWRPVIEGKLKESKKLNVYVLIRSQDIPNDIWVQPIPTISKNPGDKQHPYKFKTKAYVGRDGMDGGITFEIVAVVTKKKLTEGQKLSAWNEADPEYQSDAVEVVRKGN